MRNLSVVVGKSWSAREKIDSCKAIDSSRKNNRFQEEEEEEDLLVCGSHDGHRIGEDGQAEFGNVARLSIFTNDLIEEIGRSLDVRQNKESRLHPVCICTSRSTQFLPSFSSTEISVTWFFEKKKRIKKKEIYSSLPSINDRWSWTNSNRQSDDNRVPAGLIKCGWDHDDIHHPA